MKLTIYSKLWSQLRLPLSYMTWAEIDDTLDFKIWYLINPMRNNIREQMRKYDEA